MASYFDEHDMSAGEGPPVADENLLLRIIQMARQLDLIQGELNGPLSFTGKAPPASKKSVEELETEVVTSDSSSLGKQCAICLAELEEKNESKILPCRHQFHSTCILTWLKQVNSCPECRHELPTDDEQYEELRKHKARAKQREFEQESLHNSMFG